MLIGVLLTLFLVILNGFFVAAEFAIVKVRKSQIDIATANKPSLKKITDHIMNHVEAYLAATQLGITVASLALGWIGEGVAEQLILAFIHFLGFNEHTKLAHQIAMPIAFIFVTFLHVVFGEIAPKTIAIRNALATTLLVVYPLQILYFFLMPFVFLFNGFANFFLRKIGVQGESGHGEIHTEEELQMLIKESEEHGTIQESKADLLEKVFTFDDKLVKEVMTKHNLMRSLDVTWELPKIMEMVVEEGFSRFPIYKNHDKNIIGMLYTKDLMKVWHEHGKDKNYVFTLKDHIKKDYLIVTKEQKVGEVLREFQKKRKQIAIVKNENKETIGLITLEDILEELLGEIYDEHDDEYNEDDENDIINKIDDNQYAVNALAKVTAVNRALPKGYPHFPENDEYVSLSGFIVEHLNRIPKVGEVIRFEDYEIKIGLPIRKARVQIKNVIISYIPQNNDK